MDQPQERLSTSAGPTSTGGSPSGQTLRRLAEQLGVSTSYESFDGQEAQVPDATLSSVLTALDLDVSSERAALDSGLDIEGFKRNWEKNMQALEVVQRTRANMVEQGRRDKEAVTNILNDAARAIANSDNQETFAIER